MSAKPSGDGRVRDRGSRSSEQLRRPTRRDGGRGRSVGNRAATAIKGYADFAVNEHQENLAYNEILTNPDVLSDYTLKFFGPEGPYPVYESEGELETKGYPPLLLSGSKMLWPKSASKCLLPSGRSTSPKLLGFFQRANGT